MSNEGVGIKENANRKSNSAGAVFGAGSKQYKMALGGYLEDPLGDSNPETPAMLLADNLLYVHDSEYFAIALNCMSLSLITALESPLLINGLAQEQPGDVMEVVTLLTLLSINIENEISGGLIWTNFDQDLADFCVARNISLDRSLLKIAFKHWFRLLNLANTRVNQTQYISLSIGALNRPEGAMVCDCILEVLGEGAGYGKPYIFPNVQFRVKATVNGERDAPYYSQYRHALAVTARQMNPTYILCDSAMNMSYDIRDLHVTGCRSP